MVLAFSILIFLAVVVATVGFVMHRSGEGARELQGRLRDLAKKGRELPGLKGVERDKRYSVIPWLDGVLRRINIAQSLEMLLYKAGMQMRVGVLLLLIAAFGMGGYFFGIIAFHRAPPAMLFMLLLGPLPYAYVRYRKHQRMKAFSQEFPDSLDLLVSALRAGLSFSAAMQIVAEESPEPVRGEFAITVEEQSLGLDFRESLVNLTRRVDSLDLRFFVTAIVLQRETGGNLAEILDRLSDVIRKRFDLLSHARVLSAQQRYAAIFVGCSPMLFSVIFYFLSPGYFDPLIESPAAPMLLGSGLALEVVGFLIIWRLARIKV